MSKSVKSAAKAAASAKAAAIVSQVDAIASGGFAFAKGSAALVEAIKAAMRTGIVESVMRKAAMGGAIAARLGKSIDDAATRADVLKNAERILSLKAAHLGNSDAYRTADEQRAYDAAKKVWQRAYGEAKGAPKAKRKPQPAKGATSGKPDANAPKSGDNASPVAAPLNFAEYVKRPPVLATPDDAKKQARNLAALMTAEMKQSAKALPQEVRAMYRAFVEAAKALAD